jgi:hypothetical protein
VYSPSEIPEKIPLRRARDQANRLVIDAIFVTLRKMAHSNVTFLLEPDWLIHLTSGALSLVLMS